MKTASSFAACICALVAALALSGAGCEKLFQKEGEKTVDAGDKKAAAGDVRMAIKFYEAALDGTARTAGVHFKMAMLYDDKLHQPVSALHHFDRYLELVPEGPHAKEAKAHQKDASMRLSETLKGGAFIPQAEAARINKENLELKMQIVKLKAQKSIPAGPTGPTPKGGELVQKPLVPGVRTYTVLKGDTLGSIAAKFYKNKGNWPKIRDANFQGTKGTPPIRQGQVLMIP